LVTWNELNRRYKEVVKYPRDSKTRHLSLAFHHLYCFAEIHKSELEELKQTLAVKMKWKKHDQHFQEPEANKETGGARWWSPRSIEKERHRLDAKRDQERRVELQES
jgi:hypothetical protein